MQGCLSYERLSVRPSVKRVNCDKTKAPSEKSSIMTNRKSPTSFPMSLRWTAYVASNPPKGTSKTIILFSVQKIIGLSSKKVCYKVSLCENFQWQSFKVFTGLSIRAQMIGGDVSLYLKFWIKVTHPVLKRRIPFYSSTSVTASEKSSIITNRKSTTRFPMSLWSTSYPASKLPKGRSKTQIGRSMPVLARYL